MNLGQRVSRWIFGDADRVAEEAAKRAAAAHLDALALREDQARALALEAIEAARIRARQIARMTPEPMPRPLSIPDVEG